MLIAGNLFSAYVLNGLCGMLCGKIYTRKYILRMIVVLFRVKQYNEQLNLLVFLCT